MPSKAKIEQLLQARIETSTLKQTAWGVRLFREWSEETTGAKVDFQNISREELNDKLKYFYAETRPKASTSAKRLSRPHSFKIYTTNTMKSVRAALNRHLKKLGRNMDIVRDTEFKTCNSILEKKLRIVLKSGLLPKGTGEYISMDDMKLIAKYVYETRFDSYSLQCRVWYCLVINFLSVNVSDLALSTQGSFEFRRYENGPQCVVYKFPHAGYSQDAMIGKPGAAFCPVSALGLMIAKTDIGAKFLFNRGYNDKYNLNLYTTNSTPTSIGIDLWYGKNKVAKTSVLKFMVDISREAKCSRLYNSWSLHKTAILARENQELRHIMFNVTNP